MGQKHKTFWMTDRLFSKGITREGGRLFVDRDGKRYACFESAYSYEYQTIGNNAHETKEDAIAHAKKMIAKELASMGKQRAKLLKMAEELK